MKMGLGMFKVNLFPLCRNYKKPEHLSYFPSNVHASRPVFSQFVLIWFRDTACMLTTTNFKKLLSIYIRVDYSMQSTSVMSCHCSGRKFECQNETNIIGCTLVNSNNWISSAKQQCIFQFLLILIILKLSPLWTDGDNLKLYNSVDSILLKVIIECW